MGPGGLLAVAGERCGGGGVFCDENAATLPATLLIVVSGSEDCISTRLATCIMLNTVSLTALPGLDLGKPCFKAAEANFDEASGLDTIARWTAEAADPLDPPDSPT